MKSVSASLTHIVRPPRADGDPLRSTARAGGLLPTLIMLHGRGTDERDLFGLAQFLDPRLFVVSARAPFPFQYGGGYAWYDVIEVGLPEPRMFAESHRRLMTFVDEVVAGYPVDPERVFLLGFSMGTVMAHSIALAQPAKIAGVVAHSGYLPPQKELDLDFKLDDLNGRAWFVAHGLHDPIIPIQFGRETRDVLAGTAAELTYNEYPIAHQVSESSLADASAWLSGRLDSIR